MSDITEHVGKMIRLYRKIQQMSMEEFASRIHKSKPTVSKYENGTIGIDIDTLFEIAKALNVSTTQLLPVKLINKRPSLKTTKWIFSNNIFYLYFYDGRFNRLIRGLIQVFCDSNGVQNQSTLYMNVESFANYKECKTLYCGTITTYDLITNFTFENQANEIEQVNIIALNPFGQIDIMWALISGVSDNPILPISFRCIISPRKLDEDDRLLDGLIFSREDFKLIKKYNAVTGLRLV
jgi:transcriptional regulator with XRE-family HTH domain